MNRVLDPLCLGSMSWGEKKITYDTRSQNRCLRFKHRSASPLRKSPNTLFPRAHVDLPKLSENSEESELQRDITDKSQTTTRSMGHHCRAQRV
ncbi:hypothetical protein VNO77_08224 [Canavalia gladiata]|uniref:Uncharacterized protein n=1 Tax=Canavalia gladiata TaxID=3824 RepID=A0AAN9QTQ1_CANGL